MRKVLYILGRLTDEDVDWMSVAGERRRHEPGDILVRQGEPVDALMFLLDGKVGIDVEGVGRIARLGSGEMLGEMPLVDEAPPAATAVVMETAHVLHLPYVALHARLDAEPDFAARLYHAIAVFLSMRMRLTVQQLGYGKSGGIEQNEIDMALLETVTVAGGRFDRMIKRLMTA